MNPFHLIILISLLSFGHYKIKYKKPVFKKYESFINCSLENINMF